MAVARMTRAEQTRRNRERVLDAAHTVFAERGYHGATVEQIAEAAGFSTGVVYSQFGGKADLFLALLEGRIEQRARDEAAFASALEGEDVVPRLAEHALRITRADPAWGLLVLEFRVHAARDPELRRRYAELHARTVEGLAEALATLYARSDREPRLSAQELAEVMAALDSGIKLETAAGRDALTGPLVADVMKALLA